MWFKKRNMQQQQQDVVQPLLLTLQQVHDQARVETQRSEQMMALIAAIQQQTAALTKLADSNQELVAAFAQLLVSEVQPEDEDTGRPDAGMGDARGGYVQRDGRVAQQSER